MSAAKLGTARFNANYKNDSVLAGIRYTFGGGAIYAKY
jgi:hypothetical protein